MSVQINDQVYYRTAEACRMAGISRSTLFRWLKEGTLKCATCRDRNGWRLFTDRDVDRIRSESYKISIA